LQFKYARRSTLAIAAAITVAVAILGSLPH
jgi:hypothetical protein